MWVLGSDVIVQFCSDIRAAALMQERQQDGRTVWRVALQSNPSCTQLYS